MTSLKDYKSNQEEKYLNILNTGDRGKKKIFPLELSPYGITDGQQYFHLFRDLPSGLRVSGLPSLAFLTSR